MGVDRQPSLSHQLANPAGSTVSGPGENWVLHPDSRMPDGALPSALSTELDNKGFRYTL